MAWVANPPPDVSRFSQAVPSACTFWPKAEEGVFFASAEDHMNCPIGAMTMGFDLDEPVKQDLMSLIDKMCVDQYIDPSEPGAIPGVEHSGTGIVYGPLEEFPIEPQVVLVWLTPRQLMIFSEATGDATWGEDERLAALGRPTCAALPIAIAASRAASSLGCIGMRTFTGIGDELILGVIPGSELGGFLDRLREKVEANETMREFYEERREAFA